MFVLWICFVWGWCFASVLHVWFWVLLIVVGLIVLLVCFKWWVGFVVRCCLFWFCCLFCLVVGGFGLWFLVMGFVGYFVLGLGRCF